MKKKVVSIFVSCLGYEYRIHVTRKSDRKNSKEVRRIYIIDCHHDVIDMLSSIANRKYQPIVDTNIQMSVYPTVSMKRL